MTEAIKRPRGRPRKVTELDFERAGVEREALLAPTLPSEPMTTRRDITEARVGELIDRKAHRYTTSAYANLVSSVLEQGTKISPRGQATFERLWWTGYMPAPRSRIIRNPARKMNGGFAVAEFLSTVAGRADLKLFTSFISDYGRFSSDGMTLDGCYGTRVNYVGEDLHTRNQLLQAEEKIRDDIHSRQAVVAIYQREDLSGLGGKNTPCTLNLQFLARKGILVAIANMRSNDVVLGFPYDVFNFTMIQEFLARRLALSVGEYMHNAGSLHLYEKDLPLVGRMMLAHESDSSRSRNWAMPAMPHLEYDDITVLIDVFLDIMEKPRTLELVLPSLAFSSRAAYQYCSYLLSVMLTWAYAKVDPYLQQDAFNWMPQDYCFDELAVQRFGLSVSKRLDHQNAVMAKRRRGRTRKFSPTGFLTTSERLTSRYEAMELRVEDEDQ